MRFLWIFLPNLIFAEAMVSWITPPPAQVTRDQEIVVSWKVVDMPGSYRALFTVCPLEKGPHCKKNENRQQGKVQNASESGSYEQKFTFDPDTPPGQYYAVGYAAYSTRNFQSTPPVLIEYK